MKIEQGDIFWANLNPTKGHEQAGQRPVLVLQNNLLNQNLTTIVISPLTTNMSAKGLLTTYFLSKNETKLKSDSIALLYQMRAIDKLRMYKKAGQISEEKLKEIKFQMALVF